MATDSKKTTKRDRDSARYARILQDPASAKKAIADAQQLLAQSMTGDEVRAWADTLD